jgi:hypothetical protein
VNTVELQHKSVDLDLPDSRPSTATLMGLVADMVAGVGGDRLVDVQVVATQLVDNAYRHARAPRWLWMHRLPDRDLVRIQVGDGSPSRLPVLGRLAAPEHGRGLLMVNRLSVNWGHERDADRKTVWAEVRLA